MSDIPALPKFYVLTIPGTPRHVEAERQLASMGVEYEFVHGRVWPDNEVPWRYVCNTRTKDLHNRYRARVWGCKEGHMRLVEKALNDGCEAIVACEDDLWFEKTDLKTLQMYCDRLDELGGVVHFRGRNNGYDQFWLLPTDRRDGDVVFTTNWPGCVCSAIGRDTMKFYLEGMRNSDCECDRAMCLLCRKLGRHMAVVPETVSPVWWNNAFQGRSNITGDFATRSIGE